MINIATITIPPWNGWTTLYFHRFRKGIWAMLLFYILHPSWLCRISEPSTVRSRFRNLNALSSTPSRYCEHQHPHHALNCRCYLGGWRLKTFESLGDPHGIGYIKQIISWSQNWIRRKIKSWRCFEWPCNSSVMSSSHPATFVSLTNDLWFWGIYCP